MCVGLACGGWFLTHVRVGILETNGFGMDSGTILQNIIIVMNHIGFLNPNLPEKRCGEEDKEGGRGKLPKQEELFEQEHQPHIRSYVGPHRNSS
jgi:hypothetical protein